MSDQNSFYQAIVEISEDYFGPASRRFINRIALSHLGKPGERLTQKDLPELITWVQLAASVMTDNSEAIEEYIGRLRSLLGTSQSHHHYGTRQTQGHAH
jgi:hypothetical protein